MILNGKIKKKIISSKSIKQKSSSQLSFKNSLFTNQMKSNNINVLNFIKQKNKFYIPNNFDENNSRNFLDSKNKALGEIYLSDELELNNKNKKDCKKNDKFYSTKMLKTPYINEKTSDTDNNKNDFNTTNKLDNSNDSNFIYKFILDNANESEEIFLKKLKKQMKSIEVKNKTSQKNISKFSESKFDKKKSNFSKQKQSLFKGPNPFRFSKEAKILMINQPIDASSIKSSCSGSQNIFNSKISSKDKEEININNILKKESDKKIINNNSINDIEIDSDKESLMNILSGFM
jgi:hypothetical protein